MNSIDLDIKITSIYNICTMYSTSCPIFYKFIPVNLFYGGIKVVYHFYAVVKRKKVQSKYSSENKYNCSRFKFKTIVSVQHGSL